MEEEFQGNLLSRLSRLQMNTLLQQYLGQLKNNQASLWTFDGEEYDCKAGKERVIFPDPLQE